MTLPSSAGGPKGGVMRVAVPDLDASSTSRPNESVDQGNLPVILNAALRQDLEMSPGERTQILKHVQSIKTREQARKYLAEVQSKLLQHRSVPH